MESFQDIEHFVKTLSAAIKKKIPTKVSQLTNDAGYKTTDTTYKLSKTGSTVTLTGSDGSTTSVTDDNATYSSLKNPYSLDIQNNGTTVASYDGSAAKTVNLTNATSSADGLMSAADKKAIDREFFRMLPKGGTYIPKDADLNSIQYLKVRNYYNRADAESKTIKNIPVAEAFMMYVLSPLSDVYDNESTDRWVYRLRIFVTYTGIIFTQMVYSGSTIGKFSYDPWVKMTNSDDLSAVSKLINDHIANKSNPHAVTKGQVGLGNVANIDQSKAIKSITRSGTTFTATALDGTTTTFTQQDSSTTYSVATSSADGLMSKTDKAKLDGIDPSAITTNAANIKKNADEIATYIAGQRNPDLLGKGAYIGRKIEGGGTIFFDYAIGFKGDISVAPITKNLHSYHVDPLTGVVMCDDPEDTTKQDRFMVVSDYDIGDYKHGNNLMWSNGTSGSLYTAIGTATGFGTGKANTEKCIAAATTDNLIGWNTNAYNCIWHYVSKGDWNRTTDRGTHVWFVPSKDELNVLLNMQWSTASKRKSYDGKTQLIQLPINFYSYYWSSSESFESSDMEAFNANFCGGGMNSVGRTYTVSIHVRLVRFF